jgi:hypothetical protein
MNVNLDSAFESWGNFTEKAGEPPSVPGRLSYDPRKGIELQLVESRSGSAAATLVGMPPVPRLIGRLVDGTLVTLQDCIIAKTSLGAGAIGLPTALIANRVLFGAHVADVDTLRVKKYTLELSSLSNWMCASPVTISAVTSTERPIGVDVGFRRPEPIRVALPDEPFDVTISSGWGTAHDTGSVKVHWHAGVTIEAHDSILIEDASKAAWQCEQLMGLLIGRQLSDRSVTITPADEALTVPAGSPLQLIYQQCGKHDEPDAHPAGMFLPYQLIREQFPQIVRTWFARSEQAVLAANVFFGSQLLESPAVNVKFLAAVQAAESYHRALGTGLYMDQAEYDKAIGEFLSGMPASIQGDHRQSLKNRLKYGNEHSLRKRLTDMFGRIPENARTRIASEISRFVGKVVDTRNYYTHYDLAAQQNAFEGRDAFVAAERMRILVVANLLHELGINDETLLSVLQRSREFQHWMSQGLPL